MPSGRRIEIRPGVCLADIARATGLRKGYVGVVFAGKLMPAADKAVVIARFLGIDVPGLLDEIKKRQHAREVSEGMANARRARRDEVRMPAAGRNWGISAR